MATAPKCSICGSAHWGVEHVWPDAPKPKPPKVGQKVTIGGQEMKIVATKTGNGRVATFDRTAYQREYMRKRRASAKANRT